MPSGSAMTADAADVTTWSERDLEQASANLCLDRGCAGPLHATRNAWNANRSAGEKNCIKARSDSGSSLRASEIMRFSCWIPTGCILTWNAGAERFKGYRADEIIGQHFSRFYPHEALAARTACARARGGAESRRIRR